MRLLSTTFLVSNLSLFERVTIYRMLLKERNRLRSGKGDTIRRGPRVGSAGVNTRPWSSPWVSVEGGECPHPLVHGSYNTLSSETLRMIRV